MTEVGNKQGYTGVEHKKERSVNEGDNNDEEKEETEGGDDIFCGIKQIDVQSGAGEHEDIVISCICRRR